MEKQASTDGDFGSEAQGVTRYFVVGVWVGLEVFWRLKGFRRGSAENIGAALHYISFHCVTLPQIQKKKGRKEVVRRDVVLGAGFGGLGFVRLCEGLGGKGNCELTMMAVPVEEAVAALATFSLEVG